MNGFTKNIIESYSSISIFSIQTVSAMLTPLIGILTIYIAYQQWKTNRNKFKLDLYEKRRSVYIKLKELLITIRRDANIEPEISHCFMREVEIDKYLFDKKERDYLTDVYNHSINLWSINKKLFDDFGNPINIDKPEERKEDINNKYDELKWLTDQFERVEVIFAKYFIIK